MEECHKKRHLQYPNNSNYSKSRQHTEGRQQIYDNSHGSAVIRRPDKRPRESHDVPSGRYARRLAEACGLLPLVSFLRHFSS